VCHLGALQEFIFKSNHLHILKNPGTQKVFKTLRWVLFIVLMVQLAITRENLFEHIDPFRVAFNITSRYPIGWILMGLLLLTSLFIYRPFCNGACPVGLVFGFIERIPMAKAIRKNSDCVECGKCVAKCPSYAISENKDVKQDACIMCGNCLDICKKQGILLSRKEYEEYSVIASTPVNTGGD
jgi:polyferredoxin